MMLFTVVGAWAQGYAISGVVVDERQEPLIGATVRLDGVKGGCATGLDGSFTLSAPGGGEYTMIVTCFGYKTQKQKVNRASGKLRIAMEVEGKQMDEVVVIGYGTAKKSELTASVEMVSGKDLAKIPAMNLDQSLAGQAAGLGVKAMTGDPSSARESRISIRGNLDNPLLVIDGVPRFSSTTNEGEMRLSDLNPDDIESISILKDAAAAAVYGSRAANGVILVQTKRGRASERARINYRGQFNFDKATYLPNFLGAKQFAELYNRAVAQDPDAGYKPYDISALDSNPNLYGDSNLFDYFRTWGHSQRHSLSLSGGSKALRYLVSGGYTESKGLYSNIGRSRYNYAVRLDTELYSGLTMAVNLSGAVQRYRNNNNPVTIDNAYGFSPIEVLRYTDGSYASLEGSNPLVSVMGEGGYQHNNSDMHTLNGTLRYDVPGVKGLNLYVTATYDMNHQAMVQYNSPVALSVYDKLTGAITVDPATVYPQAKITMTDRRQSVDNMLLEGGVNYRTVIDGSHNLSGTLVWNYQDYHNKYLRGINPNLPGEKPEVIGSTSNGSLSGNEYYSQRASTVGRFTYGYDSRYFAEFSFRVDGSTRFAPDRRWGFFPTMSGSWVISNEPFFANVSPATVSQAKLRASYGVLGDDGTASDFGYMQFYNFSNTGGYNFGSNWLIGLIPSISSYPNKALTWGKSQDVNLGLDLGVWNNRITTSIEWYRRLRTNMVTDAREYLFPPSVGTGGVRPSVNVGKVLFTGVDFSIRHNNNIGDFGYDLSFNIGTSTNRVLDWGDESTVPELRRRAGKPYMVWQLYEAAGLFQSEEEIRNWKVDQDGMGNRTIRPGDIKYLDQDGDNVLTVNDMILVKNSGYPDVSYGFGLGGSWKGLHLNLQFQGVSGYNQMISEIYSLENGSIQRFQDYHYTDTWTEQNPSASYPRVKFTTTADNNRRESTYWVKTCSFLRLKAVTLGYGLPKSWLKPLQVSNIDLSLQASNLFTLSSLNNMDPESLRGYPLQKSYGASVSFGF